jgi:6-phosphogluconolactonase/glucosamine-6-phosphate isomerase/deaminase
MTSIAQFGKRGELRVYGDAEQLARTVAELFANTAADSIEARGRFRIALSGGTTPRRLYKLLPTSVFSTRIDWNHMSAFLLNRGRTVAFLVQGPEKAEVLCHVLLGPVDAERLPAQLVTPEGKLLWMMDEADASQLPQAEKRRSA